MIAVGKLVSITGANPRPRERTQYAFHLEPHPRIDHKHPAPLIDSGTLAFVLANDSMDIAHRYNMVQVLAIETDGTPRLGWISSNFLIEL